MAKYMNQQKCLLCGLDFSTKDLRVDLCPSCTGYSDLVKKYRGPRARLDEKTKFHILNSNHLRFGTGHKYDYFDKLANEKKEKA